MDRKRASTLAVMLPVAGLLLAGCALQRAQDASDAKAALVGMPKEQLLACMGPPASVGKVGSTDVWSYELGNGRTDSFGTVSVWGTRGQASGFSSNVTTSRFCRVDVVMSAGQVSRVNYSGPTGGLLTAGEQCAFAVENCLHDATAAPARPTPISQASTPATDQPPSATPATWQRVQDNSDPYCAPGSSVMPNWCQR